MRRRGLSEGDVQYVVLHGHKRHAADAVIYFLRDKDLPQQDCRLRERLRGTAVIVSRFQPLIIAVWRNRQDGLRHIKRKPRSGRPGCRAMDLVHIGVDTTAGNRAKRSE